MHRISLNHSLMARVSLSFVQWHLFFNMLNLRRQYSRTAFSRRRLLIILILSLHALLIVAFFAAPFRTLNGATLVSQVFAFNSVFFGTRPRALLRLRDVHLIHLHLQASSARASVSMYSRTQV